MIKIWNRLINSEFTKNVSVQVAGTALAQLIPFLISPILARLYSEESFAILAIFMAIVGVLVVPNGGRYYFAIVSPEKESDAKNLAVLSIWATILYNILLLIVILLFYPTLNTLYELNILWFVVPVYVFTNGLYNVALYLSVRHKRFRQNAIAKISQTTGGSFISILMSYIGYIYSGLIIGKIAGLFVSIFFFKVKFHFKGHCRDIKKVARYYVDYPKITIIPALLDVFSLQALIFFVGHYYSKEQLGYLGLTNMILVAPVALIGVAFRDVFYQKVSRYFHERNYLKAKSLFQSSAALLVVIGGLSAILLFFFGEVIFEFVYGSRWQTSGQFASILSLSLMVKLVASPLSSIFNATNQLKLLSFWQILYFFTMTTTLFISASINKVSIENLLIVYTVHEVILYLLYFILQSKALTKFKPLV